MLDHCSISHKGGIVLWSRSFTPEATSLASSSASPVSALVREALIEGRTAEEKFEKDSYTVKWTFMNDLELIFVVVYQRILQLTYVDELLAALKALFLKYFEPVIRTFVESLHASSPSSSVGSKKVKNGKGDSAKQWDITSMLAGWDKLFDELLKTLQDRAAQERRSRLRAPLRPALSELAPAVPADAAADAEEATEPTRDPDMPLDEQQIALNVQALKNKLRGSGARRRGRGGAAGVGKKGHSMLGDGWDSGSAISSDSEAPKKGKNATPKKQQRKWGDQPVSETDMATLDYSLPSSGTAAESSTDIGALVDKSSLGTRTKDGMYEVKDWEFAIAESLNSSNSASKSSAQGGKDQQPGGVLGSLFARLTGGKVLTEADLQPVLEGMKQHLMKKNVAREIADKVCEGVGEGLVGKKVGGFQTTTAAVRQALSTSLTRILTPKTSTDLLLSIRTKLSAPLPSSQQRLPYSITFVGVNGVGKSTNLSKVCFWLIQNGLRVLIAACDTFRSGAVEQLRVHVRNLSMLTVDGTSAKAKVELFERGYGKDAAGIAREAINFAKDNDFDVVLIDTAGRMQDNEPLMRALAKLVSVNNPDKILFVGEALVGNEAVDQLQKFDRALKDFSTAQGGAGKGRGIDGMLVTKWDTVDDKVGAALSMTYVTGQPIMFVGCGQTYTDLRQLRVQNVVQAILDD